MGFGASLAPLMPWVVEGPQAERLLSREGGAWGDGPLGVPMCGPRVACSGTGLCAATAELPVTGRVLCAYRGLVASGTWVRPALKLSLALCMGGVQMPRH